MQRSTPQQLILWSLTVALAGLLFGFDTAVISGAEEAIDKLWSSYTFFGNHKFFHGFFITSMALWGTVFGALLGGIPTDRFGRKKTLIAIGVLYLVSAIGSALAQDPYTFSVFRFIGGLGVGASSVAAPTYISEIAPANRRGTFVILYQFFIVFGILVAFFSNYLIGAASANSWRWMLGIEAVPAALYLGLVILVPESPRWLILKRNAVEKARAILQKLNPGQAVDALIQSIQASGIQDQAQRPSFFSRRFRFPIMLAFLVAFFNQVSGINFVLYYAKRIFTLAGMADDAALLGGVGLGVANLVFTMLGVYLIDRAGRKQLMLIGSIGYIVTLSLVAWAFKVEAQGQYIAWILFAFLGSHAIGQGAVIWVFISEIFPNSVRAYGQAFGSGVHWVFAALITLFTIFFMDLLGNNPWYLFAFFAGMMVLQLLFVLFIMPETKGRSLEELERELLRD